MKQRHIIGILLLITLPLINCDNNSGTTPLSETDLTGSWTRQNNAAFSVILGLLDGQSDDRVLFCDESINGIGCVLGTLTDNQSILLDDTGYPALKIETSDNTIRISSVDGFDQTFTGTFERADWNEGSCGLYIKGNNRIGPLENNCIVGEWYSFERDPFTNESFIIYKNYSRDGTGELIKPHENLTITFTWIATSDSRGDIVKESNYGDQSPDREYAYLCTEEGLALGSGGSWIRNNIQCLF